MPSRSSGKSGHASTYSCELKGHLTFLILWLLSQKPRTGAQLAEEIGTRRGVKPNPGTIYPALSELVQSGAISFKTLKNQKIYSLTPEGLAGFEHAKQAFCKTFCDLFGV